MENQNTNAAFAATTSLSKRNFDKLIFGLYSLMGERPIILNLVQAQILPLDYNTNNEVKQIHVLNNLAWGETVRIVEYKNNLFALSQTAGVTYCGMLPNTVENLTKIETFLSDFLTDLETKKEAKKAEFKERMKQARDAKKANEAKQEPEPEQTQETILKAQILQAFKDCKTKEALKTVRADLLKLYHPDIATETDRVLFTELTKLVLSTYKSFLKNFTTK